jgi:hypothetical protein
MRIVSPDGRSWVELDRLSSENGYDAWAVEASTQTAHGDVFRGRNGDLHLLNIERFVAALDAFVLNRQTPVQVDGTYDSFIRFTGTTNGVVLEFRVGAADHLSKSHAVSGAFPLAQEALLQVVAAFKEVASIDT